MNATLKALILDARTRVRINCVSTATSHVFYWNVGNAMDEESMICTPNVPPYTNLITLCSASSATDLPVGWYVGNHGCSQKASKRP